MAETRTPPPGGTHPPDGTPPEADPQPSGARSSPDAWRAPAPSQRSHAPPPGLLRLPGRISGHEVFQLLGEGGMGQVFLARSTRSHLVALKVIRPEYADDPDFRARFHFETRAAKRVSGNFTSPILDADADAERPWLAARYVPAPSLAEVVNRFGVLSEPAVRALGTCLAQALQEIHEASIVHRDIKPDNVLMASPRPLVIDFGISALEEPAYITRAGQALGTSGYMAPEQFESAGRPGPPADVFSLAAVLVYALTGHGPFGSHTAAVFSRTAETVPDLDGVPGSLRQLVERCLGRDPAGRPQPGEVIRDLAFHDTSVLFTPELRQDLARREQHATVLNAAPALPLPAADAARRLRRRHVLWVAGGGTVVAAGAAALLGLRAARGPDGKSTVRPDASAPKSPAPVWETPAVVSAGFRPGLGLAGDTLVLWDQKNAKGYDRRTGKPLWTARPQLPSDALDDRPRWLGVHGSTLFATVSGGRRTYLIGMDVSGRAKFVHPVTDDMYITDVLAATSSVALITSTTDGVAVRAVDLASGRTLWSRKGSMANACIVGDRCLVSEAGGHDLHCFDLRSGRTQWSVDPGLDEGPSVEVVSDGTVALLADTKLQAFAVPDGRRLWTRLNQSTTLDPVRTFGERAYLSDGDSVFALNTRTGDRIWHVSSGIGDVSIYDRYGPAVTSSLVAMPLIEGGFAVLRAADGKVLWIRKPTSEQEKTNDWWLRASGTTVYAASGTFLYALGSRPRDDT
ncbi:PQQ-binding-like beta-propeller repeat protein [Streptomyces sp. NPDC006798]|uniref:protein kinase domain-containing protein n=1 Tax=Streptomyces sp. NPDC006798 TaxID=3155462 RepID=UPI0033F0F4BB